MKNKNIAVLAQPEYLNNGLQTFEKNVNQYLLDQPGFSGIYHNYRGENKRSYPFSRTVTIYKTGKKLKKEADNYDKVFIPSQSRATFDPEKVEAQIIPYIHDVLPYTSAHSVGTAKGVKKMVQGFQELFFENSYMENIEKLDKVIAASHQTARDLRYRTNFSGEIQVIYQGVDDMPAIEWSVPNERDIDLIYIGTLHERKNPELIRKTFRKAQRKGFTVASINYQELDLPGKTYTDISDKEMAELLGRSRYYLHPSKIEGFGRGPVEAQRYGCFPLGLDTQINQEVLGDHFSTIGKAEDVIRIIESEIPDNWRRKASEYSKKYTWEKTCKEIEQVLKE